MIEIKHLSKTFQMKDSAVNALKDISLTIPDGSIYGIIGMSGAGKSTLVRCINLLERPTEGSVVIDGVEMEKLTPAQLRQRRREITMIFQQFNLLMQRSCLKNICFPMELAGVKKEEAEKRAVELLRMVGLSSPEKRVLQYPHQLSGGMRQRVMIAMALACQPNILIADEPTTALDVTVQAQILQLLRQLKQAQPHSAVILVTHDMGVIAENADRVAVMYAGQIVEEADVIPLFHRPLHPYTEGLMASMPSLTEEKEHLETIEGTVPSIYNMPIGCAFCNRCKYAKDCCRKVEPKMMTLPADESGIIRRVRCLKYDENYRKEWENG